MHLPPRDVNILTDPKATSPAADEGEPRVAFIIKGPPTYLTAEEAQHQGNFKPRQCTLFVAIPEQETFERTKRIESVINPSQWSEICWIRITSKKKFQAIKQGGIQVVERNFWSRLKNYRQDAALARRTAATWGQFDIAYTVDGAFYEHFAYQLKPKRLTILESGISMLSRFGKSGYINYRERARKLDRLILALYGYKIFDRSKTALFTSHSKLDHTRHEVVTNTNAMKAMLCSQQKGGLHSLWIGTPLCEFFGVTEEAELAYINEALDILSISPRDLVYVPHPGKEDAGRLQRLSKALGCELDARLIPVEAKVARGEQLPKTVISPLSSSLANLAEMLPVDIAIVSAWHRQFNAIGHLSKWRNSHDKPGDSRVQFIDVGKLTPLFKFDREPKPGEILFETLGEYAKWIRTQKT